jgi:hypothetical protein
VVRTTIGALLAAIAVVCGCASPTRQGEVEDLAVRPPATPTPAPSFLVHVVKFRGETLGQITEWYTGRFDNWRTVARANDLAEPHETLSIGREVRIPSQLVVRRDAMPAPKKRRAPKGSPTPQPLSPGAAPGEKDGAEPVLPPVIGPK